MAADGPTVAEYLEGWLELQQTQLQPSTWESYKANLGRYLLPAFGGTALNDLRATELSRLYVRLLTTGGKDGAPLSLRTIRYVHSVLHKALEDARRHGEIAVNVSSDATLPRIDPHRQSPDELQVWTAAQLRSFLDHASGHPLAILWELAAGTGMRRGELLGLRWHDIDLEARHLTVRHALSVVRRHVRLKPPKTGRVRVLALDRRSCDALVRQREQQMRWQALRGPTWSNEWDLAFTTDSGRPLVPDVVSRQFRQLVLAHYQFRGRRPRQGRQ